jgi:hypothetical protein
MSDELNPAAEYLYPAEQEQNNTQQTSEKPQQQESQKENNMRILRERAEAAERRSLELERMVQMNMSQQQGQKIQIDDSDDDFDLSDDTYIEGKHLKKYVKNLKQELRNTKKQFEEYNQQNAVSNAEMRLKSQFNDFDSVVTKENLDKLASQKPSLYRSILSNPDLYDKGYTAYEFIKNSDILSGQYQEIDRKVEENRSKPRSAANVAPQSGDTPLARVGDYDRRILTEERKDQLRRQVEEAKRYKQ